jgi:hypothetical protein
VPDPATLPGGLGQSRRIFKRFDDDHHNHRVFVEDQGIAERFVIPVVMYRDLERQAERTPDGCA